MRLLFLGAAYFQVPPIAYAVGAGHEVFTLDNRPHNPGHKLAHRSFNVSTLDIDRVWDIVNNNKIDAVFSYGSDVSAPTAAYCNSLLGIISEHQKNAVSILTNKSQFREFLNNHNIQPQFFKRLRHSEPFTPQGDMKFPLISKPCFNSGSKGVSKINTITEIDAAISFARKYSLTNEIIIESFIEKEGFQICGDGYIEDGSILYIGFGDGHFYNNSLTPYAETFPSTHSSEALTSVTKATENILNNVGYLNGPFNIDAIIDKVSSKPFIFEIGPRNGGNFIPQAIHMHSGIDITKLSIDGFLGSKFKGLVRPLHSRKFIASYMLHSKKSGILDKIEISDKLKNYARQIIFNLNHGDKLENFFDSGFTFGNILLDFSSHNEMQEVIFKIDSMYKIKLV